MEDFVINNLMEIIDQIKGEKDLFDYISILSVPILSLTALIITWFFSKKQIHIATLEFKYKRELELYNIYVIFNKIFIEIKHRNNMLEKKVFEYETMILLFDANTVLSYNKLVDYIKDKIENNISINDKTYREDLISFIDDLLCNMRNNIKSFFIIGGKK